MTTSMMYNSKLLHNDFKSSAMKASAYVLLIAVLAGIVFWGSLDPHNFYIPSANASKTYQDTAYINPNTGIITLLGYYGKYSGSINITANIIHLSNPNMANDLPIFLKKPAKKLSADVQYRFMKMSDEWPDANDESRSEILAEAELLMTLDTLFNEEFKIIFSMNSTTKSVELIKKYQGRIKSVSESLGIEKTMIDAVIFRELRCFFLDDYLDPLKAIVLGDAQMGLGQICIKTAKKYEKMMLGNDAPEYDKDQMIRRLMDNDINIYYIGIILKANAISLNLDANIASAAILAGYNGLGRISERYGYYALKYSEAFSKYFKAVEK
jgi:hypothetical protein